MVTGFWNQMIMDLISFLVFPENKVTCLSPSDPILSLQSYQSMSLASRLNSISPGHIVKVTNVCKDPTGMMTNCIMSICAKRWDALGRPNPIMLYWEDSVIPPGRMGCYSFWVCKTQAKPGRARLISHSCCSWETHGEESWQICHDQRDDLQLVRPSILI